MHHRTIAILAILFFAFGEGGCASKSNKDYEEVLMPLQTGSVLHRRVLVPAGPKKKPKQTKKHSKPETEPAEKTPAEEENTPPPERFR
ncbi:MAG: hypothetical protein DLM73_02205 [Chthoniobacterales bacterium]|nr:MAG: hypothetical protein DLM73_02205 [Chthoniobacterales bacterium]